MANNENLKPFTKDNAKYYGKKGGINSAKSRAERKSIKEQLQILLSMPVKNNDDLIRLRRAGFEETEMNNQTLLTYSLFEKAIHGDAKSISLIFKTIKDEDIEKNNMFYDLFSI